MSLDPILLKAVVLIKLSRQILASYPPNKIRSLSCFLRSGDGSNLAGAWFGHEKAPVGETGPEGQRGRGLAKSAVALGQLGDECGDFADFFQCFQDAGVAHA